MGRLFNEKRHDSERARNVWEAALRKWQALPIHDSDEYRLLLTNILAHLADLEEKQKRYAEAIRYLEMLKPMSPAADAIQKQLDELRRIQSSSQNISPR